MNDVKLHLSETLNTLQVTLLEGGARFFLADGLNGYQVIIGKVHDKEAFFGK